MDVSKGAEKMTRGVETEQLKSKLPEDPINFTKSMLKKVRYHYENRNSFQRQCQLLHQTSHRSGESSWALCASY